MSTSRELDQFLEATGESSYIDAKGPMTWDKGSQSASLAKDMAAFANSKDGGVLVIGKSENESGQFEFTGLTDEQATSFETTKVATWVNNRFSPRISLVCHQHDYKEKRYVIVTIEEFSDVPILCTKSLDNPADPKRPLLKKNTIYVRNANAESAPLQTVDEFRELIGLATSKRAQEMYSVFEGMLKGKPILPPPDDKLRYEEEVAGIEEGFGTGYENSLKSGAWRLILQPGIHVDERWEQDKELEGVIQRHAIRLRDQFPPYYKGNFMMEWGLCNDTYGETWTLTRSGLFLSMRPYLENQSDYQTRWRDGTGQRVEPSVPPGGWVDFKPNLLLITEMFLFASRFAEEFDPGEEITIRLQGTSLLGRKLVTTEPRIRLPPIDVCRGGTFGYQKRVGAGELIADWESVCTEAIERWLGLFPGANMQTQLIRKWIDRFKNRQF